MVLAPFADSVWSCYWLKAPRNVKVGQKLYLEMMKYKFPTLSVFPTKYSLGAYSMIGRYINKLDIRLKSVLPRRLSRKSFRSPVLNYLDFGDAFRSREDYLDVINQSVEYLRQQDVAQWIDMPGIVNDHLARRNDYQNALNIFVGLAINHSIEAKFGASDG